jgi:hypothetical protein
LGFLQGFIVGELSLVFQKKSIISPFPSLRSHTSLPKSYLAVAITSLNIDAYTEVISPLRLFHFAATWLERLNLARPRLEDHF